MTGAPNDLMRCLGIIDKPTKLASKCDLVGRLAARCKFLIIDKPTKLASESDLVGRLAAKREFLIIDKPTKLTSEHDLVGRPAARRAFLIIDKPTKLASEHDLVGRLAARRAFLLLTSGFYSQHMVQICLVSHRKTGIAPLRCNTLSEETLYGLYSSPHQR